jgi:hypothetical protein
VAEPAPEIGWAERRDGALAGLFFGALGAGLFLVIALVFGAVGWWRGTASSFGQFFLAQLVYSAVIVVGVAALGAWWDLRRSRGGRLGLWLTGSAIISGAMLSLLRAPVWRWDQKTWGWLLLMTPAFAWVLASGGSRRAGPGTDWS